MIPISSLSEAELQLPPHSIEMEEAVLGGLLLDPMAIDRVVDLLSPEAFYLSAHQQIYRAALDLHVRRSPTDLMSVATWLHEHRLLDNVGGQLRLASLLDRTVSAVNIDVYAHKLREKFLRRQLIQLGNEQIAIAHDGRVPIEQVIDASEQKLYRLSHGLEDRKLVSVADTVVTVFEQLEKGVHPGLLTGWYDLDAILGGLHPGALITAAGATSMGKTHLAIALSVAIAKQNRPVVFFTCEMSQEEVTRRLLAHLSLIDSSLLNNNRLSDSHWPRITNAIAALAALPIYIYEASTPSLSEMRSALRRIPNGESPGLVILDYLQLLGDGAGDRVREIDLIVRGCKHIAIDFHVPFLALAQINRAVSHRSDKRPTLSDLRESGSIEQSSNQVIFLYRDDYYDPNSCDRGLIELGIAKNRGGQTGVAKLLFDARTSLFLNLKHRSKEDA